KRDSRHLVQRLPNAMMTISGRTPSTAATPRVGRVFAATHGPEIAPVPVLLEDVPRPGTVLVSTSWMSWLVLLGNPRRLTGWPAPGGDQRSWAAHSGRWPLAHDICT